MRRISAALGALFLIAITITAIWLVRNPSSDDTGTSAHPTPDAMGEPASSALIEKLDRLEEQVSQLTEAQRRLSDELLQIQSRMREPLAVEDEHPPVESKTFEKEPDPLWFFKMYIKSFEGGGSGSEYFRLAVAAYTPTLMKEIAALLLNSSTHPVLRIRLAELLSDSRLSGNGYVIDVLMKIVLRSDDESLARTGLKSLGKVGTAATALDLERIIWSIPSSRVRNEAIQLITRLDRKNANEILARLLRGAGDDATQMYIVNLLQTSDPDSALEAFRLASQQNQPVRLAAAKQIRRFRSEAIQSFVNQWAGYESDERVRMELERAKHTVSQTPSWCPQKATGPPDADPPNRDHPNAWATKTGNMGEQWIELGYKTPMRVDTIRIFEVNVAGAVSKVIAVDESGKRHTVWSGIDPTSTPGVFEIKIPSTSYRVRGLRIVLDTDRHSGWNEIDAVEIVGPDGRAWASEASASSSYGQ